jgi:hypothetical protein
VVHRVGKSGVVVVAGDQEPHDVRVPLPNLCDKVLTGEPGEALVAEDDRHVVRREQREGLVAIARTEDLEATPKGVGDCAACRRLVIDDQDLGSLHGAPLRLSDRHASSPPVEASSRVR